MKSIIIASLLFCVLSIHAQENQGKYFIIPDAENESIISTNPSTSSDTKTDIEYHSYPKILHPSTFYLSNSNFNETIYDLKHDFSYILYNNSNILQGIGGRHEAGGMLIYQPNRKLSFGFGANAVTFSMNGNSYNDYVFSGNMTYRFNHWLTLYLYYQHALNSQKNSLAGGYYLSPQSCYGGMLMIKVLDKSKYSVDLNIGAERAFNPLSKQWEMNYRLGPEIRIK